MRILAGVFFLIVSLGQLISGGCSTISAKGGSTMGQLNDQLAQAGVKLDPEAAAPFEGSSTRGELASGIVSIVGGLLCLVAGILCFANMGRIVAFAAVAVAASGEAIHLALTPFSPLTLALGVGQLLLLAFCALGAVKLGAGKRDTAPASA